MTSFGDSLKPPFVTLAIALIAAVLGAGAYAYYESSTTQNNTSGPAPIIDGRTVQASPVGQFPSFTIHPGKTDADGFPTSNARLCVNAGIQCFALLTKHLDSQTTYFFGLEPKAERVALDSGGSVVFFSGTFSAGGSGILESFALLKFDSPGKISNLLPPVYISDGGDRHIWKLPNISPMPVVAFAEHVWADGEAHYGEHFWQVSVYGFDSKSQLYSKQTQYTTTQKYSDDDSSAALSVLENEKSTIIKKLTGRTQSKAQQSAPTQTADSNVDQPIINVNPPSVSIPSSNGFPAMPGGSSESVPTGAVEIKSTGGQDGIPSEVGAIVCPNFNTYGAWYDAATTHFHLGNLAGTAQEMDKQMKDLRNQTREIFHDEILLRQYGCSYLPNGTPANSGGATSGHMALITVTFPGGTKIGGVTLPDRLSSRQR